jgi:molybdopterin synthase catalytic subunit
MSVRLAAIRDTALSVDEVLAAVSDPSYGGVAIFLGTVRDHDDGRSVTRLEYSAHRTAESELQRTRRISLSRRFTGSASCLWATWRSSWRPPPRIVPRRWTPLEC